MIPENTAPGTEIVALYDDPASIPYPFFRADPQRVKQGSVYRLRTWMDVICVNCGEHGVQVEEIDPAVVALTAYGLVPAGDVSWCPNQFDVLVKKKLPEALTKFVVNTKGEAIKEDA